MKIYIPLLALSALTLGSCADFLDVQAEGVPTTTSYFSNDKQAIDAINGLYAPIHQEGAFGLDLFWEQAAACDVVWAKSNSFGALATFAYTGNEWPIKDTFDMFYTNMARSNWIISKLLEKEQTKGLTAVEHRSLGEAFFMRGMAHFWVAYRYGTNEQGVPFVRYEDFGGEYNNSIPPQQASVIDDYKYIIEDMDKAVQYLPKFEEYTDEDKGRPHKASAVAYKAKVYAYWATWDETQWNNVITMVNSLESEYGRGLADTFAEIFSSDFADFWNREYIWSIPSTGGPTGGGVKFPGTLLESKGWGKYNGWGEMKSTYDIYEEMAKDGPGNDRLVRSILEYNQEFEFFGEKRRYYSDTDLETGFQVNKYMDAFKHKDADKTGYVHPNGNYPSSRVNFPLIRFAEMLLFRAEAYLMTNQADKAKTDLNRLRKRSNLTELEGTVTMKDLYHERRCELAFEYTDHLFDLKRWHRSSNADIKELAAKELNALPRIRKYEKRSDPESAFTIEQFGNAQPKNKYQDYMIAFPYPYDQITKSNGKLKQNKGYN